MGVNQIRETIADVFEDIAHGLETGSFGKKIRVGLTVLGSEHGPQELVCGAELAQSQNPDLQVVVIGSGVETQLETVEAADEKEAHAKMDQLLLNGSLDAAVTMHYSFPIGVSTIGKVLTPAKGKEMLLATTTGTSATERVSAMLRNAIYGIAAAKACGKSNPTVGILNIDGARQVERSLKKLQEGGYPIQFVESARADGGVMMRGNDLLMGVPDIMVLDSLTGNVLMKVFSAYSTGGSYESLGSGYGPGVGEAYDRIICIISRASGAPVISGAIRFAADCAKGKLLDKIKDEFAMAKKAGWDNLIKTLECAVTTKPVESSEVAAPPKKPVTEAIPGIDVMQLEDAVLVLWKAGIYAESGMGCTGPIVMIAPEDQEKSVELLKANEYL
ncbi:glycine/sarcosine/betaine reductase complex component C subunit alpha [Dehalobacterium formicoaceticum]|uniref:Glycine/sarcosine/betaine reductase complex component C subunit alpha n=1 Tax=Dehalobacterium formicoaceticum TaxID=51515 RepID=A0ABT1XZM3_9FIRM|nr:glycine/sarcosine/betaine reductase complex component C subunit alpha [Dehalobacterium formicoaceticum]MCR6544071.1 glycine/sarcosine/betaine reductase complex component C subunit alpha [Dehalobacterium formicoaceticum]